MTDEPDADFSAVNGFEWDENKRLLNIAKHGVDFADAIQAFADPKQFTYRSATPPQEQRYVCVGMVQGRLIAVVTTLRGEKLRIISARAARRNERDWYG